MGVYTSYFQKSKVFLYPLLKINKGISNVPIETYVSWDNFYAPNDLKFFCKYKTKKTKSFIKFANSHLVHHPLFQERIELDESTQLFIYDFSGYKSDFKKFLSGKYSQFTLQSKINILDFFNKGDDKVSDYIDGFLSPDKVHSEYAEALKVDVKDIETVHEVCTPPDLEKETLVNNNYVIDQLLKNSSIYLSNINNNYE